MCMLCLFMQVCVHPPMHMHIEVIAWGHVYSSITLSFIFLRHSLTKEIAPVQARLAGQQSLETCLSTGAPSSVSRIQARVTVPSFYVGSEDLNSSWLHAMHSYLALLLSLAPFFLDFKDDSPAFCPFFSVFQIEVCPSPWHKSSYKLKALMNNLVVFLQKIV